MHEACALSWVMSSTEMTACREEHACRFCQQKLPDWQTILTPHEAQLPPQCLPTMSVTFNDEVSFHRPDLACAFRLKKLMNLQSGLCIAFGASHS